MVVGAIAGQVGGEVAEQAVKEGIQQTTKQIITEGLEKIPKESLEQTFGRQIPRSYLNSTGEALTKSGAERYYRTSIRRIIREGGENGPEQAIEATVKALGVSRSEAADIVVGNLGVALTRQSADEAVQAALKASGRSLKEIICATPSAIRGFLGSVYDNAIRLGRNPRQALRDTKKLSQSIAFQRAKMTLGWSVAASTVMILGYNAWQFGSGLFDRTKPEKTKEQAEQEVDQISGQPATAIIGQSVMGLTAIGIGGVALLGVLTMGGEKKDVAVAASEEGDFVCEDCGLVFVGDKPDVCDDCGCTDIQPMLQDKGWDPRDVHNPWKTPPENPRSRMRIDRMPRKPDNYDELVEERRKNLEKINRLRGKGGFDEIDDSQMDQMIGNVLDRMREEGMAIGPVQSIDQNRILTDAERAEICDLARLFVEDNEDEIRQALANGSPIMWVSWWEQRNPFLDESRYPTSRYSRLRRPGGIKHIPGRMHFRNCLGELVNRMRASRDP